MTSQQMVSEQNQEMERVNEGETDIPTTTLGNLLSLELEKGHQLKAVFRQQLQEAGGSKAWLKERCPKVFELAPGSLSEPALEAVLLTNTLAFWEGIEARKQDCGRCPPAGAVCVDSWGRVPEGRIVRLVVSLDGAAREYQIGCDRYQDFVSARRLVANGVDVLLSTVTFSDLGEISSQAAEAFVRFVGSGPPERAPKKSQLLIEGKRCREYAVVLLTTVKLVSADHTGSAAASFAV